MSRYAEWDDAYLRVLLSHYTDEVARLDAIASTTITGTGAIYRVDARDRAAERAALVQAELTHRGTRAAVCLSVETPEEQA